VQSGLKYESPRGNRERKAKERRAIQMAFRVLPHPSNPKPRRSFPKKDHAASTGSSRVAGEEGTATLERLFQHPDIKKIVPVTYSINCRLAKYKARSVNTLVYPNHPSF
jgi:hypothetical protein